MPQLSVYLNDASMVRLQTDAASADLPVSRYISQLIIEGPNNNSWPAGYWDDVYGSLNDDSFYVPNELPTTLDTIPEF